jgi:hypothetical protein
MGLLISLVPDVNVTAIQADVTAIETQMTTVTSVTATVDGTWRFVVDIQAEPGHVWETLLAGRLKLSS